MTRARDIADQQENLGGPVPPVTAGKNVAINGGQDIWQRGTSFTTTAAYVYCSDRWYYSSSSGGKTVTRQTTGDTTNLPNIQYCIRLARNSGQTDTTGYSFHTALETASSIPLAGKIVTFSFYARKGANFSGTTVSTYINTGTGTDQAATGQNSGTWTGFTSPLNAGTFTPTTTWTRYSFTATIGATATQIGFGFLTSAFSGTAGAADHIEFTGLQLEVGSVATPFSRAAGNLQGELAACQRYYVRYVCESGAPYAVFAPSGFVELSTYAICYTPLPVQLRAYPTSVEYGGSLLIISTAGTGVVTGISLQDRTNTKVVSITYVSSGLTATTAAAVRADYSSTAYLGISAEL